MCLVRGSPARAELLEREHELDRVEEPDDPRELGRSQSSRDADELVARHVDVDQHPSELHVVAAHFLFRDRQVEAVRDDEAVDDVELGRSLAVEPRDDAVFDLQLRRRVVRPPGGDESEFREGRDQQLAAQLAVLAARKAAARRFGTHFRNELPCRST